MNSQLIFSLMSRNPFTHCPFRCEMFPSGEIGPVGGSGDTQKILICCLSPEEESRLSALTGLAGPTAALVGKNRKLNAA